MIHGHLYSASLPRNDLGSVSVFYSTQFQMQNLDVSLKPEKPLPSSTPKLQSEDEVGSLT